MKNIIYTFIILLFALSISCEKNEDVSNPFIGTWETTETTQLGSVVATIVFRADMTLTFTITVNYNGQNNMSSMDYAYSYTNTQITIKQEGELAETTDYIISGNTLTLSMGVLDAKTYTKVN